MSLGDILGFGVAIFGFVYVLGAVFYIGFRLMAKLRLRPAPRLFADCTYLFGIPRKAR